MKAFGNISEGRYAGVLTREHIRMLVRVERSGSCTRDEALAGSALATEQGLKVIMQLERNFLIQETGGLMRITPDGSALLTSLGLGAKSFRKYFPCGTMPAGDHRWLESMALLYREHYHGAWLHTLQCLKFWSWVRKPGPRKQRRKHRAVHELVAILLHDILFHPLPPIFQQGYPSLSPAPSFIQSYLTARDMHSPPRYSLPEYLRLKDLFFRHERYSVMYLLEARHYQAQLFRLNMRNIYHYFLLETRPHRKTVATAQEPAPPPPGTRRLPELTESAAPEDLRHIPQDYWPLQIPCASKHFFADSAHDRISQVIRVAPFTIRIHDIITYEPLQLSTVPQREPCCSLQVLQRVLACEQADKTAFFECGPLPETAPSEAFHRLQADMYYCAFRADIRPADLIRLSATWPQLSSLAGRAAAWLHGEQPAVHLHANELVNTLLSQVLHCTYIGDVAECFLRRVCIDLLLTAAMQNRMTASKRHVRLTPADKTALYNIFNQARLDAGILTDAHYLAGHFHISRYKFLNGFQQEFGITPKDYQQMLVMYHAFHLLHRNGKSMLITAIRCGFETPAGLRSAFIRHFGCDPCHLARMQ